MTGVHILQQKLLAVIVPRVLLPQMELPAVRALPLFPQIEPLAVETHPSRHLYGKQHQNELMSIH